MLGTMGRITLHRGDITDDPSADAIVNAANRRLLPGGGVCGAIHRGAGPELAAECRALGGCATGDAVITGAGRLQARHVIHAVGPVWQGGRHGEPQHLAACYRRAIELAEAAGCARVAFPAISTGVFGYPLDRAADTALKSLHAALDAHPGVLEARLWLFDATSLACVADAHRRLESAVAAGLALEADPAVPIPDVRADREPA